MAEHKSLYFGNTLGQLLIECNTHGTTMHKVLCPHLTLQSWGYYATKAWSFGLKPGHYCCYDILVEGTGAIQTSDTTTFDHHSISLPHVSNANPILKANKHLQNVIDHD